MAADSERVLIDTNVLVYAMNSAAPEHAASRSFLDRALRGEIPGVLTAQILLEYVAVVTNPNQVTSPLSAQDAAEDARALAAALPVLHAPEELLRHVLDRAADLGVGGRHIFDLQHAVTAHMNGVSRICTYDAGLRKFAWVEVQVP